MDEEFNNLESSQEWDKFFKNLNYQNSNLNFCKEATSLENIRLNRYIDVLPFEHNRIKLLRGKTSYINASLVCVEEANRKYIFTQGPLENTIGHFWLMVLQQKSKAIIMLTRLIENNIQKCFQYWPIKEKLNFDDLEISIEIIFEEKHKNYIIRKFCLEDLKNNFKHEVYQFHYIAWPDFNIPKSPNYFLEFLYCIRSYNVLDAKTNGPPIVHCSAGIGRTGTFCAIDSLIVIIEKNRNLNVNIPKLLLSMRKYRTGLIQTCDQFRFVYLAVLEGSKKILNNENKMTKTNSRIANDVKNLDQPVIESELDKIKNDNYEIKKRSREEKRKKTFEILKKIKEKKKYIEDKYKFNKKLIKIGRILFALILFVSLSMYYYKVS